MSIGTETAPSERLQKVMANAGLGSRRALEKQIKESRVSVNGKAAVIGQSVAEGDLVGFDGQQWRVTGGTVQNRTLIYNKPEGEVTTRSDPEGRPTVFDRLPRLKNARWIAIGRLDINTTGLLLLTTDGELAHAMMHPSSNVDREYACRIRGEATPEQLEQLREGVELDDGPASFSDIQTAGGRGENHWYHVTLLEGRNREVRRLWESQGLTVSRLKRVRYGAAFLPKRLRMGQRSEISPSDHAILREDVGLAPGAQELNLEPLKGPRGRPSRKAPSRKAPFRKPPARKGPSLKEPGGKEPGQKESGRKESGRKESGRKESGRKEPGRKESGRKEPSQQRRGKKKTAAKPRRK